jgi:hypothetical protein
MPSAQLATIVRFTSALSEEQLQATVETRKPEFTRIPGLVQKFYLGDIEGGTFGAIYLWENAESAAKFRESELFASIPGAYQIEGPMDVRVAKVVDQLR